VPPARLEPDRERAEVEDAVADLGRREGLGADQGQLAAALLQASQ
jgi:hypothetical protein